MSPSNTTPQKARRAGRPDSVRPQAKDSSDADLVLRAREGDRWAYESLFRRHVTGLTRMTTRLLARQEEADDVVQDSFAFALTNLDRLRDPEHFRAWLYRIAVNKVKKRYRSRKVRKAFGLDRSIDDAALAILAKEDADQDARTELALLDQLLSRLPAEQRLAWMLRHVEGQTLPAVAGLSNCSLATAKRRIAAADSVIKCHVRWGQS